MNAFASLAAIVKPRAKPALTNRKDPRKQFARAAEENIKAIRAGAAKGTWFVKKDGEYIVTLRNGVAVLKDNGKGQYPCPDADTAITFITKAAELAASGAFDAQFKATARGARKGVAS